MKSLHKFFYVLMLFSTVLFTACNKNSDDGGGEEGENTSGTEYLTAKVDGTDFEAAQDPAVIVSATVGNNVLSFQGGKNNGETIRGTINGYSGVGTYRTGNDISNPNSLNYITLNPTANWGSTFNIGSGTVEITMDDGTTIEGTFSFEGLNADDQTTKNITQGNFKALID